MSPFGVASIVPAAPLQFDGPHRRTSLTPLSRPFPSLCPRGNVGPAHLGFASRSLPCLVFRASLLLGCFPSGIRRCCLHALLVIPHPVGFQAPHG